MSPAPEDASARGRGLLAVLVGVVVGVVVAAVVLPPLLTPQIEPLGAAVAVLALALAAVLGLGGRWAGWSVRLVGAARASGDGATPVLSGRVTDPARHPVRPRAPGTA